MSGEQLTSREAVESMSDEASFDGRQSCADMLLAILSERDAATARAEAAERERDEARNVSDAWAEQVSNYAAQRDAATAERDAARAALQRWQYYGCPDCGGDCASANPPVACCIMQETRAALAGAAKEAGE